MVQCPLSFSARASYLSLSLTSETLICGAGPSETDSKEGAAEPRLKLEEHKDHLHPHPYERTCLN